MGRERRQSRVRHAENAIGSLAELILDLLSLPLVAAEQALPDRIDPAPYGRNPTDAANSQNHSFANRCIRIDAFVPPKPKEFERTVFTSAGRDWLATISRSKSSSSDWRIKFGA